ncbi:hypothetical protein ZOSMA_3G01880 [Zostera marina]|uniref:Uncharacterized protein n=1 Tax=Zostera marina TaxID=29655 RepID=A0A0K9P3Z8_ZOSMR|nr:hypothetical protein ZOSMA_3G01880 [Zostera marina]
MDSGDTESFIQFLTDTHLSLKSWVPRFQNAFGGKTQSDETSIDNATDAFDEVVSLSPLVSPWWADNCKVEGGKQLFLLTPLPRSKQPPKTVSRLCGPNFLKCSGKKIIHMTPFSIVRPPPLPSARKFPCEGVDVAETVEVNATTKTKKIKFRKGTPFVKSDKKSKLSDDLDCDDEFMVDLASRFPKLLENSVVLEKQPLHSKSMHEQGLKLLDLEVVDSDSSTTTSEEEEMGSSDWKGKGESTLKRDLWTKFEALSVLPPQMQDDDTYILQNTSMKGFLEILEEEGGLVKQSTAESEMRDIKVD